MNELSHNPSSSSREISTRSGQSRDLSPLFGIYDSELQATEPKPQQGGFDFWQIYQILNRSKWVILLLTLAGLALSYFYVNSLQPLFKATTTVELQNQEIEIVQVSGVETSTVANLEFVATQFALLRSRALATQVALDPNVEIPTPGLTSREDQLNSEIAQIINGIDLKRTGFSRVLEIGFIHTNPRVAATVSNALADKLIETNLSRRSNANSYAREFLQEQVTDAKNTLEDAERRLVAYADAEQLLDLGGGTAGSLESQELVALNQQLSTARDDVFTAQRQLDTVTTRPLQFEENSRLSDLTAQRETLALEMQGLTERVGPRFPAVLQMQERLDVLDGQIQTERQNLREANLMMAQDRLAAAQQRLNLLESRVASLKVDLQDTRRRSIDYTILEREVDTARAQYDALLKRFEEIDISSGAVSNQITIVDRATIPRAPFSPRRSRILAVGLVLGLAVGIGAAFARSIIDDTIKTPDDVKNRINLPALGVIPKVKSEDSLVVNAMSQSKSDLAEAYFSARTALRFSTSNGAPRSLLLTSNRPDEGKTSSCVALGIAFARAGDRVLLIDGDMRKPSFVADAVQSIGLSGLLTNRASLASQVMQSSIDENLFLLPGGLIPPNPAELLSNIRMRELLLEAEQEFDLVIVDAPPILSFTDAPLLASYCEATLLVIKAGTVRYPAVQRGMQRLREARGNLIGAILTHFDAQKAGYSASYYYYAYGDAGSKYGAEEKKRKSSNRAGKKIDLFNRNDKQSSDFDELTKGS